MNIWYMDVICIRYTGSLCYVVATTCLGALFVNSNLFVDSMTMPKWFWAIGGILVLSIYYIFHFLFTSRKMIDDDKHLVTSYIIIMIISTFFQALYGIFQYFNIYPSMTCFQINGSFDNPAGFAACLVATFPFFLLALMKTKKLWRFGVMLSTVLVVVAVILSESRAGVLSLAIILLCWMAKYITLSPQRKRILILIVLVGLVGGLYHLKKDSANGRLLIWRCSIEMIKDHWFAGYGPEGFEAHYMDYQAHYFEKHPNSPYAQLADDVQHPFNEYLNVWINYGLIGFLLLFLFMFFLSFCYFQKPTLEKRIAILSLISIGVFSLFSYPTRYPFVWLVMIFDVYVLVKEFININRHLLLYVCFSALLACSVCSYILYQCIWTESKWKEITCRSDNYSLFEYDELAKTMENNRFFMYNYVVALYNCDQREKCLSKALLCRKLWANYDLELLLGDIYRRNGECENAERYYENASLMCPCRFFPLYQLYELYKETGNNMKALLVAKLIIAKPIKKDSMLIKRIKKKIKAETGL